jgi:hypothetical protein
MDSPIMRFHEYIKNIRQLRTMRFLDLGCITFIYCPNGLADGNTDLMFPSVPFGHKANDNVVDLILDSCALWGGKNQNKSCSLFEKDRIRISTRRLTENTCSSRIVLPCFFCPRQYSDYSKKEREKRNAPWLWM